MPTGLPAFSCLHDLVLAAKSNLQQEDWDYVCGGAETETTVRRNRWALDCLAFRPRVLRDVTNIDVSGSLLGHRLRIPVVLAPIGGLERLVNGAALAVDDAAQQFGTINLISSLTTLDLQTIATNSSHPKILQIYVRGDHGWLRDLCRRAVKTSTIQGVALTVDSALYGNRERLSPAQQALRQVPRTFQRAVTWDTVKLIQDEIGGLPLLLKGIMTPEDAVLAVDHGVEGVYVSNHGGRQLDHVAGAIELLPEIVRAVGRRVQIVVDGGFVRGTDVVKALALGAAAVGIGRLQCWALAAGGTNGLVRCLELLEQEIEIALGLVGVTGLEQLDETYLTKVIPATLPGEFSAFPHLGKDWMKSSDMDGRNG